MHLLVVLLLFLNQIPHVDASGTVKIKFLEYSNPDCIDRTSDCEFYFYQFRISIDGTSQRSEDLINLPVDTNIVDLKTLSYFSSAFSFNFPAGAIVEMSWEVWEDHGIYPDEKIQDIDISIPLSNYTVSSDWQLKRYSGKTEEGDTAVLSLEFQISNCDPHFTGRGCSDCTGNWNGTNCDTCKTRWDIGTNCTSCTGNWNGPDCDTCHTGWDIGTNCARCAENWNGSDCDTCHTGWDIGTNCTSCKTDYYPTGNCSVYCLSNDNFACTAQGVQLCTIGSTAEVCVTNDKLIIQAFLSGMLTVFSMTLLVGLVGITVVAMERCRNEADKERLVDGATTQPQPQKDVIMENPNGGETIPNNEQVYDYYYMDHIEMKTAVNNFSASSPIIPEPGVYND